MARAITVIPATKDKFTALPTASIAKRRVAAYARVSTDSDEQFTSYEAQIDYYICPQNPTACFQLYICCSSPSGRRYCPFAHLRQWKHEHTQQPAFSEPSARVWE